jgi:hypothetical protein
VKLASARPALRAMTMGNRSTKAAAASAAAAAMMIDMPNQKATSRMRGKLAVAIADPIARPAMNATSIALNA